MECFFILLTLVLLALLVAPVVIAVLALRASRKADGRLLELELAVSRLEREAAGRRAAAAEPASQAPPAPEPTRVPPEPPPSFEVRVPPEAEPPPSTVSEPPAHEPPPPAAPPPAEPPEAGRPAIDWERWIGVRGAAVLGGILFALAGLYFVRYAVESGWLAPPVRVALGLLAGLGAVVGSEVMRRRGYEPTANALAGGGVVVLYASVWAARTLYELIPAAVAFATMTVITAAAGVLAWRHRSQVIAVLGLVGGFATPLLLRTGAESPLGLFGYLLLLNLGLVLLARRRRWPLLAPLGLVATLLWEAFWITTRMEPGDLLLALVVLAVFAALFTLAVPGAGLDRRRGRDEAEDAAEPEAREAWTWTRAGGLLAPFAFALYLAVRADLTPHVWPLAALMLVLAVAAELLERGLEGQRRREARRRADAGAAFVEGGEPLPLGTGAAVAAVAVVAVWALRTVAVGAAPAAAWEVVGVSLGLAVAFHAFAEHDLRRGRRLERTARSERHERGPLGALVTAGGFLALLLLLPFLAGRVSAGSAVAAWHPAWHWAWIAGWLVLGTLLVRQGWLPAVRRRPVVVAAALGLAFPVLHLLHRGWPGFPEPALHFAVLLAVGVAFQGIAVVRGRGREEPAWEEPAALALPLAALIALFGQSALAAPRVQLTPWLLLGLTLTLALLAVLAATRLGSGNAYLAAVLLVAMNHTAWAQAVTRTGADFGPGAPTLPGLLGMALAVLLFAAWPFLARRRFEDQPTAWWAAALAGPLWFLALRALWLERFGDAALGLLPVLLGAVALAAAFRVRALWGSDDPRRLRGLVWFGAVALGFAALAVPLQLDREWITIAWALEGVAVLALWQRLDHPGLKWFGVALLAAVTVRLVANPEVPGYHPRSGLPILNWLLYTYLLPAACLAGASLLLARHEVRRARPAEGVLYGKGRPVVAMAAGVAAIVVVFVWINLTVFDLFSSGRHLTFDVARTMARDLTLSLAWALYALVLLALGFARRSRGVRGIGLGLLTLTVVKLFLYDLAGLEDLYRVASLLGLAVSLVLVSLAYQRFVFRERPAVPEEES